MQRSSAVETNCVVAEYRIPYRIGPRTIITHAHRAPLIDGLVVSGFRAALDLDTYPHRNFVHGALYGLNLVEVSQLSLCILTF